jgi:hypothetical protein
VIAVVVFVISLTGPLGAVTAAGMVALMSRAEIAFNGYTRFHMWVLKRYRGTASIADIVANPGSTIPASGSAGNRGSSSRRQSC